MIDLEELGEVQHNETSTLIYYRVTKQRVGDLIPSDEVGQYIDIRFGALFVDWTKPADDGRYNYNYYGVRPCTQDDFGYSKEQD